MSGRNRYIIYNSSAAWGIEALRSNNTGERIILYIYVWPSHYVRRSAVAFLETARETGRRSAGAAAFCAKNNHNNKTRK